MRTLKRLARQGDQGHHGHQRQGHQEARCVRRSEQRVSQALRLTSSAGKALQGAFLARKRPSDSAIVMTKRLANVDTMHHQDNAERALNRLARIFASQVETLKHYRTSGQQKVTVEHGQRGRPGDCRQCAGWLVEPEAGTRKGPSPLRTIRHWR